MTATLTPIPIAEITTHLRGDDLLTATARLMEWTAIAQAMHMIHGPHHAADRLVAMGCPIRFDHDDKLVLLWPCGPSPFGEGDEP